jgi:Family of unknown function (DUF6328)
MVGAAVNEHEKRDRQMVELLNELRVALPGVQLLFGFLLTVPFTQRFGQVTSTQKTVFYATLVSAALSAACLIAPSATHRLRFHQGDRKYVIETAHKYTIAGLAFLAVAIVLALTFITDVLYDGVAVYAFPVLVALVIAGLWFARPLARGDASSGP